MLTVSEALMLKVWPLPTRRLETLILPAFCSVTAEEPFQPSSSWLAVRLWPAMFKIEPLSCTLSVPVRCMLAPRFSVLPESTLALLVTLPVVVVEAVAPLDRFRLVTLLLSVDEPPLRKNDPTVSEALMLKVWPLPTKRLPTLILPGFCSSHGGGAVPAEEEFAGGEAVALPC